MENYWTLRKRTDTYGGRRCNLQKLGETGSQGADRISGRLASYVLFHRELF